MKQKLAFAVSLIFTCLTQGCGGDTTSAQLPRQLDEIAVPTLKSFDIGAVDSTNSKFYLSDLGGNAVAAFSTQLDTTLPPLAVGAFAGDHTVIQDRSHNGPDGIVTIPGKTEIYVGDVNSVKIIDSQSGNVKKTLVVSTSNVRVDEGCYDADDEIIMMASPEESPPVVNFISTKTQSVIGNYTFSADTSGLEQCVYDPHSKSFLINNDGTTTNPNGEIDVLTAASITTGAPLVSKVFALGSCGPAGLALGPNNDMVVGCDPFPPLTKQITLVLDRSSGVVLATVPFGGSDAVAYDPVTNRYFIPAFLHQNTNVPGNPALASPMLGVIDAQSKVLIAQLPMGTAAHSIAIDSARHKVFVPHSPGASAPFAAGGVTVFSTD